MIHKIWAKNSELGFTLIELLVVILIIGILAAIAIPMFLNQRNEAIHATLESDLKKAALAIDTWAISQGTKKTPITLDNVELFKQIKFSNPDASIYVIGYSDRYQLTVYHPNSGYQAWYRSDKGGILHSDPGVFPWSAGQGKTSASRLSIQRINDTTWQVSDVWDYPSLVTFS